MLRFVLCLFSVWAFQNPALAEDHQDFSLLQQVATDVINTHSFELRNKPKLVATYRPEHTPVAATTSRSGLCVIILNTNKSSWPQWKTFLRSGGMSKQEVFEFALLHEVGHCVNKASARPLSPGIESESFADVYAFSKLKEVLSTADFIRQIDTIIEARNSMWFSSLFSGHNTSKALEALRSEYVSTGQVLSMN